MTRHKATVKLYVPTSLARDELALGRQYEQADARRGQPRLCDGGPRWWIWRRCASSRRVPIARRSSRPTPAKDETPRRPQTPSAPPSKPHPAGPLPRAEIAALRQIDLTAYARDVHGFVVTPDPDRAHHYELTRPTATGSIERLEVLYVPGGYWTYRNPGNPLDRGDILDLACREGSANLAAARREVAAYQTNRSDEMRGPENRRRRAEEKPQATVDPQAADAAEQKIKAEEERRREIFKAEQEDRDDAFAAELEKRQQAARDEEAKKQQFQREEADLQARLDAEARQVGERERARLRTAEQTRPALHDRFIAYLGDRAEKARQQTGIQGPEEFARTTPMPSIDQAGYPASASLRYAESLGRYYDVRDPYASLARASLDEAAAFQREQYELNRQIALADPERRDMLMLRRSIEHNDYMGQTWERIAGQTHAITGQARHPDVIAEREKARTFQNMARENRQAWEQNCLEHPELYAPLNEQMRARVDGARRLSATAGQSSASPKASAATGPSAPQESPTADTETETAAAGRKHVSTDGRQPQFPNWFDKTQAAASTPGTNDSVSKVETETETAAEGRKNMPADGRQQRFPNWFDKKEAIAATRDASEAQSEAARVSQQAAAKPVSSGRRPSR